MPARSCRTPLMQPVRRPHGCLRPSDRSVVHAPPIPSAARASASLCPWRSPLSRPRAPPPSAIAVLVSLPVSLAAPPRLRRRLPHRRLLPLVRAQRAQRRHRLRLSRLRHRPSRLRHRPLHPPCRHLPPPAAPPAALPRAPAPPPALLQVDRRGRARSQGQEGQERQERQEGQERGNKERDKDGGPTYPPRRRTP